MTAEQTPAEHDAQKAMVLAAERLALSKTERHASYAVIKPKVG
jgi:hypothetical protein